MDKLKMKLIVSPSSLLRAAQRARFNWRSKRTTLIFGSTLILFQKSHWLARRSNMDWAGRNKLCLTVRSNWNQPTEFTSTLDTEHIIERGKWIRNKSLVSPTEASTINSVELMVVIFYGLVHFLLVGAILVLVDRGSLCEWVTKTPYLQVSGGTLFELS